jgi:hypothetical protein
MGAQGGSTGSLTVPTTLDDVTPAWIGGALDVPVTSVEREVIGVGAGFIGQLARVHLGYDGAIGPASVIVKLPTLDPASRELANGYRFYERESSFYRHLADSPSGCGVRVPVCHAAIGEGNEVALVLEDLHQHRLGDQVAGCSLDDTRRALETAADLHATWWESPALAGLDWMPYANAPVYKAAGAAYPLCWQPFVDAFGDLLTSDQLAIGEGLIARIDDLIDGNAQPPLTVTHGDFRLDNLFFPDDDGGCIVIDWQIASRARSGCLDVAYFLSGNLDPEELEREFEPLLHHYHDHLVDRGVSGFSFAEMEHLMRIACLACLAYPVLGATTVVIDDDRAVALFRRMIKGYFGLAEVLDAGSAL